jgi:glycosyltransferase involved in cell wall biosynthesis
VAIDQYPDIRHFNYFGLTYEIVKALNENGYRVDIADLTREHVPTKSYDLFIGHGGRCRTIIDRLPAESLIFQYISGAYWHGFNEESRQRYERFARSRGIKVPDRYRRDLSEVLEGEEYLLNKADCVFTLNCPRMISTFGGYQSKFFFTAFGAYIDQALFIPPAERRHDQGLRNFIYVGGTGGNIQKGLDVLIEAFASTPHLHLYIYCKVEDEIVTHYKLELALPNIHYIYHYRYPAFSGKLKRLMRRINFSVHAPINSGMGTAFMGTMGLGLIPVGYVDIEDDPECTVLSQDWDLESIVACIRRAAGKDAHWCELASSGIIKAHNRMCGTSALRVSFKMIFSDENIAAVRQRKIHLSIPLPSDEPATAESE